jgi:hypothetical protein
MFRLAIPFAAMAAALLTLTGCGKSEQEKQPVHKTVDKPPPKLEPIRPPNLGGGDGDKKKPQGAASAVQ